MAAISFPIDPGSSLFWQGGALCRQHCTNTKLFVQKGGREGGRGGALSFPAFHVFTQTAGPLLGPRATDQLRPRKQVGCSS